jgi:hypothetical protein
VEWALSATTGFYQLNQDEKIIFAKLAPSGTYADNKFFITAKLGSALTTDVIFKLIFQDAAGGGVDENSDGVLATSIQVYYSTGSNVEVPKPSASTTPLL